MIDKNSQSVRRWLHDRHSTSVEPIDDLKTLLVDLAAARATVVCLERKLLDVFSALGDTAKVGLYKQVYFNVSDSLGISKVPSGCFGSRRCLAEVWGRFTGRREDDE